MLLDNGLSIFLLQRSLKKFKLYSASSAKFDVLSGLEKMVVLNSLIQKSECETFHHLFVDAGYPLYI